MISIRCCLGDSQRVSRTVKNGRVSSCDMSVSCGLNLNPLTPSYFPSRTYPYYPSLTPWQLIAAFKSRGRWKHSLSAEISKVWLDYLCEWDGNICDFSFYIALKIYLFAAAKRSIATHEFYFKLTCSVYLTKELPILFLFWLLRNKIFVGIFSIWQ